jgi:polyphosphate kinase
MDNRVEILFPVLNLNLKQRIKKWLMLMLSDNVKAREQDSTGEYHYLEMAKEENEIDSQQMLCELSYK